MDLSSNPGEETRVTIQLPLFNEDAEKGAPGEQEKIDTERGR
jgi:hypothetical protein